MSAAIAERDKNEGIQLAVPGLGERLKSARLAQDIEIEKLASRIHLTTAAVEALECDDYSDMPARVFVRGYIRNYARTVGLPIDSILAQFDRQWPDEDANVHIHPSPRLAADTVPGKSWPGVVNWLVLLVLLGLFLIWWQGYLDRFIDTWRGPETEQAPAQTVESTMADDVVGPGQLALPEMSIAPEREPQPAEPAAPPVQSEVDAAMAPQAPPADAAGDEAASPDSMAETGPRQQDAAAQPASAQAAAPVARATAVPEPAAASGIVVRFSQDCWVDIRDATRTFKLFGTMKAGSEHRLGGESPYKVVIGNARAADIRVDGESFDLAPYTESNVARFTLKP
jgi:cytoskeleton protein RodZ